MCLCAGNPSWTPSRRNAPLSQDNITRERRGSPNGYVQATLRANAERILNFYRRRLTTGLLEGINSIVQAARARARGYRNVETFRTIIYLLAGKLHFDLPALAHSR